MAKASFWWAVVAIVIIAVVYEYNAKAGGVLILIFVFLMLEQGRRNGTISLGASTRGGLTGLTSLFSGG